MKTKYYAAYGSNMDERQMALRCPGAKLVGRALIQDKKLVFRRHLTVEECRGSEVPVALWEITPADEKNLDIYEAYPGYYGKEYIKVYVTDSGVQSLGQVTAMVYVMNEGRKICLPMKEYYDSVARAYRRFGFDLLHLETAIREAEEVTERDLF